MGGPRLQKAEPFGLGSSHARVRLAPHKAADTMIAGSRRALSQAAGRAAAASRGLASLAAPEFETLRITQAAPHVAEIALNRPTKNNAMSKVFWTEIAEAFDWAADMPELRAVSGGNRV